MAALVTLPAVPALATSAGTRRVPAPQSENERRKGVRAHRGGWGRRGIHIQFFVDRTACARSAHPGQRGDAFQPEPLGNGLESDLIAPRRPQVYEKKHWRVTATPKKLGNRTPPRTPSRFRDRQCLRNFTLPVNCRPSGQLWTGECFQKLFRCSDHGKISMQQEGFLCFSKVVTYIGTDTVPVLDCSSFKMTSIRLLFIYWWEKRQ